MMRKEYGRIIRLGLPILVGQLGSIATSFADNIMVGRYSTEALASASFCNNLFNMAILCCIGFTYGITPLVGVLFTRREHREIGALMRNGLVLNIIYSLLITAVMAVVYLNVHRMGQPPELLPLIRPYFLICLAGILPIAIFNAFAQWSYAINNTGMPMWIILGSNALNILGNYILIYGNWGMPELGLVGAGISTLTARVLCPAVIICIFFMSRRYAVYREGYSRTRCSRRSIVKLFQTSLPVSMQLTFETGSFSIAAVMCGFLGTIELAAYQIIVITGTLGFCIYYAIGAAVAIRVANVKGMGDLRGMRRNAWAGYHILLTVMLFSSLTFIFFGRDIMHVFTDDPKVLACATTLIFPLVLYQLGDATQINFANALRGTAHVQPMLWIAFFSYMVIGVPATYLLGFTAGLGIYGIVLSFSVSLFLAAGLFLYFFLRATRQS